MSGSLDVLKLRILLCFLESEEKGCTVPFFRLCIFLRL